MHYKTAQAEIIKWTPTEFRLWQYFQQRLKRIKNEKTILFGFLLKGQDTLILDLILWDSNVLGI